MSDWTPAAFLARLRSFGAAPALVVVKGDAAEAVSYAALADRIEAVATSLSAAGIEAGEIVALVAPNGPDWVTARLALAAIGAVVAAYDDLILEDELRVLLADGGCRHALASPTHAATIARIAPTVAVIVVGDLSWELRLATPPGARLAPAFTGPALLTYTSGTTGAAKGFFLTHENLRANLDPIVASGLVGSHDRMLLPLPLHHIYPFLVGLLTPLEVGAALVFPEAVAGPQIVKALSVARVTVVIGVPRLYSALVAGIIAGIDQRGRLLRGLLRGLLALSIALRRRFGWRVGGLFFGGLRARFGGKLRLLVSGGAHLDRDTLWPLVGLGFDVRSGYGLAETASIFTGNVPKAERLESEGRPLDGGLLRIADPGEDGSGEIELKGANVFAGYRREEANRDAFTADGWFRTGDLGRVDSEGFLYVTGRRKETIVLGGGKKVSPEDLERVLGATPFIKEIAVLERQGSLVALVLPDFDAIRSGASARFDETIRVTLASLAQGLPSYQRLAGFALVRDPLPRTRLGKYRRFLLPALYEEAASGTRRPAAGPLSDADQALLADSRARALWELLVARYAQATVTLDSSPQLDLGIDSLEWVSLGVALEERGLGLSEEAFADAQTVRDLLRAATVAAPGPEGGADEAVAVARRFLEPQGVAVRVLGFVVFWLNRIAIRLFFRLKIEGIENLPAQGPYVLVPNHISDLDPPVVMAALAYARARPMSWAGDAVRLFGRRTLDPLWRALHVFPADDRLPGRTIAIAEAVLAGGRDLTWFPEGWRSPDGSLQRFLPGIGRILSRVPVTAVPVLITGAFEAMPRNRRFPRPYPIRIVFGAPIAPETLLAALPAGEPQQRIADRLHDAVAALGR